MITVFNRSHYEQVLSPRVHKLITGKTAHRNMEQINDFEQMLSENGTIILKFFLHISRIEQKERLQARLDDPDKLWKFSEGDIKERAFWPQYQAAYEDLLARTSHRHAPWFVIPANHKWYRNHAISEILVKAQPITFSWPTPCPPSTLPRSSSNRRHAVPSQLIRQVVVRGHHLDASRRRRGPGRIDQHQRLFAALAI